MSQKTEQLLAERAKHLQWCKDRAFKILNEGGTTHQAWDLFVSDMDKHDSTKKHAFVTAGTIFISGGYYSEPEALRKYIDDLK